MATKFLDDLACRIANLKTEGLYKEERVLASPQRGVVTLSNGAEVLNLCANNYLGLSSHPDLIGEALKALQQYGYGMSSVRFICGTQEEHKALEARISSFLGMDDTILYSSCFDANTGLFETLLDSQDAVISDSLNHASIIDGIRLCKAQRFRYANNDMNDLEDKLKAASRARYRLIATDGVFSMDGYLANLTDTCYLAEKYDAMVMVDDSHAVGFMGQNGRGTHEYCNVMSRVDIISGTLGKALGGASGGYISARKEIVEWLRQRSRPYLFSNTLAPVIAQTTLRVLDLLEESSALRDLLWRNTAHFRTKMEDLGFDVLPGFHPIVPVMIGDPKLAQSFADKLLERNIYAIAFSYPIVPKGMDRIRTQMSAAHSLEELNLAIEAFEAVGRDMGVIS